MSILKTKIDYAFFKSVSEKDCPTLSVKGEDTLPSWFDVTGLAVHSIGVAGRALSELIALSSGKRSGVMVNQKLAALWFDMTLRPIDWKMPSPWDEMAGDYETEDGWIKLHTNAPHHRRAAESILSTHQRITATDVIKEWRAIDLESAIVEAGGCAAEMRDITAWKNHPQGAAVAKEPLVGWTYFPGDRAPQFRGTQAKPLAGLKVLDLTRVLAGPVATRFLAAYGADVLRIDPPTWSEPGVIPEVTLGKRCAELDLENTKDRATFKELLSSADILVHGYRPGALDALGFGDEERRAINSCLIDVSLCAYGWTGPWAGRRGFDSLVQMSSGIASYGMEKQGAQKPTPLPAQALDHATGYFMAAAAILGLINLYKENTATTAKLSLARTAALLIDTQRSEKTDSLPEEIADDLAKAIERTDWGDARRIEFPLSIEGAPHGFDFPAGELRRAAPAWFCA